MKILLVCEGLNKQTIRVQPWKHVFEIAKGLKRKNHDVCILTDRNFLSDHTETIEDIPVQTVKKGKFLFKANELSSFLSGFDVIYWNSTGSFSALNFVRMKNLHQPFVWGLHGSILGMQDIHSLRITDIPLLWHCWNNIFYSLNYAPIIKKTINLPCVRALIVPSKRLKTRLTRMGIDHQIIHVVYSGVDTITFSPKSDMHVVDLKIKLGFKLDEKLILYYGPLNSFRGADVLAKAIPKISSAFSDVHFVFLGRRAEMDYKSKMLRKSLLKHKNVHLIEGFLNQNMLLEYLYTADMVVLPFRFWPYVECPLTILETMALGKPLITTNVNAIPEIVQTGVNGLVVKPKAEQIVKAIIYLLQNIDVATRLGKKAREFVEKYYSWNSIVSKTADILNKVVTS
jgi:glycosyltransferase involved in cell wall biosynthesis